ncbi:DUF2290 domain-containing protein [Micromonospora sp. WMMD730]|uniref:DUF2290 domain-containing protein n=1 Tax=Micromonospora sp. WMMD730 TaxID=3404128 RepID=UPI003B92D64F
MSSSTHPHRRVAREIQDLTGFLIEQGFSQDQNYPVEVQTGRDAFVVSFSNTTSFAPMLKDRPYPEMHKELQGDRAFNVLMIDGAMLQLTYSFGGGMLVQSRLAFLPSPSLLDYQNDPELYEEDILYADVIDKKAVSVPLRFDYDARPGVASSLLHPVSHLTLGQYTNCRIATTAPLTPFLFVEFILRSFYNTAMRPVASKLPGGSYQLTRCITTEEESLIHVGVPSTIN